jgi:2-(1,2-epoxy-1,2-dihydrophenyl)acetyl-CoA isomerase
MTFDNLLIERDDAVAIVTLNRPKVLNALNGQTLTELASAMTSFKNDAAVRVVVLTGAGRAFSSGGDVRAQSNRYEAVAAANAGTPRAPLPDAFEQATSDRQARHMQVPYMLHTMGKPTVAAVNGVAAGAGMAVAMSCDLRIASDRARFVTAFRNVFV